jgi:hypothetical protein
MRALIIEKLISKPPSLQRSDEVDADATLTDPTHLPRDRSVVKQVQGDVLADARNVGEDNHGAGIGDIADTDDVVLAAKGQAGGLQLAFDIEARLLTLVEHAPDAAWDHPAIETELARHANLQLAEISSIIAVT